MQPVSLAEMKNIRLMNRTDIKYVLSLELLSKIFDELCGDYFVLKTAPGYESEYETIYFDTDDYEMYMMHHRGVLNRKKIRERIYINSGIAFLEIKNKISRGFTKKERIRIPLEEAENKNISFKIAEDYLSLNTQYYGRELSPVMIVRFNRITLVNKGRKERVTIDYNLDFENLQNGRKKNAEDIAVIEVKQSGEMFSQVRKILFMHRVRSCRFSKYCYGLAFTKRKIRKHRFIEGAGYIRENIDNYHIV